MLRSSKQGGPSNESTSISLLRDQQSSSTNNSSNNKANGIGSTHSGLNNRKFWGEEVTDDAIYNVYLKKITYSCQDAVYDQLPFSSKGHNSHGMNGNDNSNNNDTTTIVNNGTSSDVGSGSGGLVDGLQRAFFSKDVFRRKSLDKGSSSAKSKRSASTSDMLDYGRINGQLSLIGNGGSKQQSPQQSTTDSTSSSMSSSSLNNTTTTSNNDGIRMKNYQKILTETFPNRSSPTKLAATYQQELDTADPTQSLQWETRQIRILKAATLDHIVQYILHLTRRQQEQELKESVSHCQSVVMEEERNNVSHVMHVLFIAYRSFSSPGELFKLLHQYSSSTCTSHQQFNFILIYWLNHYPEDFLTNNGTNSNNNNSSNKSAATTHRSKSSSNILNCSAIEQQPQSLPLAPSNGTESDHREPKSLPSPLTKRQEFGSRRASSGVSSSRDRSCSSSRNRNKDHRPSTESRLIDQLLSLPNLDKMIARKAMVISENGKFNSFNENDALDGSPHNGVSYNLTPFSHSMSKSLHNSQNLSHKFSRSIIIPYH